MPGKHGSQEFRWMAEVHRSVYVSVSVFTIVTPVLSGNAVSSKRFLFGLGMVLVAAYLAKVTLTCSVLYTWYNHQFVLSGTRTQSCSVDRANATDIGRMHVPKCFYTFPAEACSSCSRCASFQLNGSYTTVRSRFLPPHAGPNMEKFDVDLVVYSKWRGG